VLEDAQHGHRRAWELGLERALGAAVASNLAFSLLVQGFWAECERIARELLASDIWDMSGPHLVLGFLLGAPS
jgi:hypothetical protein